MTPTEKNTAKVQAWREANRERVREYDRRRKIKQNYGIEYEDYLALLSQGCEVCGSMENLCVDHDHRCCPGKKTCGNCISGVLCASHNKAEGLIGGVENAEALLAYMNKKYEKEVSHGDQRV